MPNECDLRSFGKNGRPKEGARGGAFLTWCIDQARTRPRRRGSSLLAEVGSSHWGQGIERHPLHDPNQKSFASPGSDWTVPVLVRSPPEATQASNPERHQETKDSAKRTVLSPTTPERDDRSFLNTKSTAGGWIERLGSLGGRYQRPVPPPDRPPVSKSARSLRSWSWSGGSL